MLVREEVVVGACRNPPVGCPELLHRGPGLSREPLRLPADLPLRFLRPAEGYAPPGAFPDPVTRAIDEERRTAYLRAGGNFETDHYLVATYLPPHDAYSRLGELLVTRPKRRDLDAEYSLILDRFCGYLRELEEELCQCSLWPGHSGEQP